MNESSNPGEAFDSSNPFEVEDVSPTPDQHQSRTDAAEHTEFDESAETDGHLTPSRAIDLKGQPEATQSETQSEGDEFETQLEADDSGTRPLAGYYEAQPNTAEAKVPWAEKVAPAVAREPGGTPLLIVMFCGIFLAAVAVFLLWMHSRNLQERIDGLSQELRVTKEQNSKLQAQLDLALQPVGVGSPDLRIVSALYGSGQNWADVTDRVSALLRKTDFEFFSRPEWLQVDPSPGWNKELAIIYEYQGNRHLFLAVEGGRVSVALLQSQAR